MRGIKDNIYIVGDIASKSRRGFPVLGILLIILVTLKVLGKTTIPWIWILTPLWVLPAIAIAISATVVIVCIIAGLVALVLRNR